MHVTLYNSIKQPKMESILELRDQEVFDETCSMNVKLPINLLGICYLKWYLDLLLQGKGHSPTFSDKVWETTLFSGPFFLCGAHLISFAALPFSIPYGVRYPFLTGVNW